MFLDPLTTGHLVGFARREAMRNGLDGDVAGLVADVIEGRGVTYKMSLRTVIRMLEQAEAAAAPPVLQ